MNPICAICGSSKSKSSIFGGYRYKGKEYLLTRCLKCGYLYVYPSPEDDIIESMYADEAYFKNYWVRNSGYLGYEKGADAAKANAEAALKALRRFKDRGSLLDVGCAGGHFLSVARAKGYDCLGLEPNKEMAEYARRSYGLDIVNEGFFEFSEKGKVFDIVYMGDTLEHMPVLDKAFKSLKKVMRRGSLFVVDGPMTFNKSIYNGFFTVYMFLKRDRPSDNPPFHIWEFDKKSIKAILEKYGFRILYIKTFEDAPRHVIDLDGNSVKEKLNRSIKRLSCTISNNFLFNRLGFGDRVIAVAESA